MKNHFFIRYCLLLLIFVSSCKEENGISNAGDFASIYMAQANEPRDIIFQRSQGSDQIFVGASYGGLDYAPDDIQIRFEANLSLVDAYNERHGTDYLPLPLNNIAFPTQETTIRRGELQSTPVGIDVDFSGLSTFTNYLLPVTISSVTGSTPLNEDLRTAYFRIEVRSEPVSIRVMAFGKGAANNDMARVAEIIREIDPDICLIREIDRNTGRNGTPVEDWFEILVQDIDDTYNHLFVPATLSYQNGPGQYGMGVFTKYPMTNTETHRLSAYGSNQGDNAERCPLGIIDLDVNGQHLKLAATHTNHTVPTRIIQLEEIIEVIGDDNGEPYILVGNMNANPNGGDSFAVLGGIGFQPACITCPSNRTNANAWSDMTLFRPGGRFNVADHRVGTADQTIGGTHLPVITTLNVYF